MHVHIESYVKDIYYEVALVSQNLVDMLQLIHLICFLSPQDQRRLYASRQSLVR